MQGLQQTRGRPDFQSAVEQPDVSERRARVLSGEVKKPFTSASMAPLMVFSPGFRAPGATVVSLPFVDAAADLVSTLSQSCLKPRRSSNARAPAIEMSGSPVMRPPLHTASFDLLDAAVAERHEWLAASSFAFEGLQEKVKLHSQNSAPPFSGRWQLSESARGRVEQRVQERLQRTRDAAEEAAARMRSSHASPLRSSPLAAWSDADEAELLEGSAFGADMIERAAEAREAEMRREAARAMRTLETAGQYEAGAEFADEIGSEDEYVGTLSDDEALSRAMSLISSLGTSLKSDDDARVRAEAVAPLAP